eukprot:scaffold100581_cov31-Tisochrysis_lutea.AAC.2
MQEGCLRNGTRILGKIDVQGAEVELVGPWWHGRVMGWRTHREDAINTVSHPRRLDVEAAFTKRAILRQESGWVVSLRKAVSLSHSRPRHFECLSAGLACGCAAMAVPVPDPVRPRRRPWGIA